MEILYYFTLIFCLGGITGCIAYIFYQHRVICKRKEELRLQGAMPKQKLVRAPAFAETEEEHVITLE